jgi:para-nitrobenzyl esterase
VNVRIVAAALALPVVLSFLGCRRSPIPQANVTTGEVDADIGAPTHDVTTDRGVVRGVAHGATYAYRGIPYAAPPTGARRFAAPEDVPPWTAPRDARDFGACCPQQVNGKVLGSEDCLTLNLWTPKKASPTPRAVLVFIHGGGNTQGCSSQSNLGQRSYEGDEIAGGRDVVVVTMNYRLGALGFLADKSVGKGNWGIRDQTAALEWVKRNIHAFGGDPSRVMVFGESAGAEDTCAHVVSPRDKGLFSRALMESAMCPIGSLAAGEQEGSKLASKLSCTTNTAACLRSKTAEEIVAAAPGATLFEKGAKWQPIIDGDVIPAEPMSLLAAGTHAHVPFVIGDNSDETLLWVKNAPLGELAYHVRMREMLGKEKGDAALARYPVSAYPDAKQAFVAATTDAVFVCPARSIARAMAKTQSEPVYRYLFRHAVAQKRHADTGAQHGVELLFVFHRLHVASYQPTPGEERLSQNMMDAWAHFADHGDPGQVGGVAWPRYEIASDPYLALDEQIAAEKGLRSDKCDFWDTVSMPR